MRSDAVVPCATEGEQVAFALTVYFDPSVLLDTLGACKSWPNTRAHACGTAI